MEFLTKKKSIKKETKKKQTKQTFFGFGREEVKYHRSSSEHRGCTNGEL